MHDERGLLETEFFLSIFLSLFAERENGPVVFEGSKEEKWNYYIITCRDDLIDLILARHRAIFGAPSIIMSNASKLLI